MGRNWNSYERETYYIRCTECYGNLIPAYWTYGAPGSGSTKKKRILDADYSALDLDSYAHQNTHLSTKQQEQLICSLQKYPMFVRGGLGILNIPPVHLELRSLSRDEKPYHAWPFPIPNDNEDTMNKEIKRLCNIGVLTKCNDSKMSSTNIYTALKDWRRQSFNWFSHIKQVYQT